MLQGPATPFFGRLAERLRAEGHHVHRVQFCSGDVLLSSNGAATSFRGHNDEFKAFLDALYRHHGVTDQILFGDCRPVHMLARAHGHAFGLRNFIFEEGYFRPYWVTLEREGVNANSLLSRDPEWFWEVGGKIKEPPPPVVFHDQFYIRALYDFGYHVAGLANPLLFPHYRSHSGLTAPLEYAGYVKRFALLRLIRAREQQRVLEIFATGIPYYLLPLQLNTDSQIRNHSHFEHMGEVIEHVLQSFARHAPPDTKIVIKNHPLDPGLMNFGRIILDCTRRLDIQGRVEYLETGDLTALVENARGVVTVNSTVGLVALNNGAPTQTLGKAIYNLPGLTSQLSLDVFWQSVVPPDRALFERFKRCVVHATQINGGFYHSTAIALGVENSVRVLSADRSPLDSLL